MLNIWVFSEKAEQHLTQTHGNMRRTRQAFKLNAYLIYEISIDIELSICGSKYFTAPTPRF